MSLKLMTIFVLCSHCFADTLFESLVELLKESDNNMRRQKHQEPVDFEYDFIIVGGGTAGCTLASRLSENLDWKILLLEAGGFEEFFQDIPAIDVTHWATEVDWFYKMERSETNCKGSINNQCPLWRGKVLGGSSMLNMMLAARGNRRDYDHWAALGNPGWAFQDVLPYFIKAENMTISRYKDSSFHGTQGPLHIMESPYHTVLGDAFLDAGKELGYEVGDYNGETQAVFSHFQLTQTTLGRRDSAANAYLYPILQDRPNLYILTNSLVTKLLWHQKAINGVEVQSKNTTLNYYARREVILSAGAINTPQILMLSGIGPKKHLENFGIPVRADLPVGSNLQDHVSLRTMLFSTNLTDPSLIQRFVANDPDYIKLYVENGTGPYVLPAGIESVMFFDPDEPTKPDAYPKIAMMMATTSPLPFSYQVSRYWYTNEFASTMFESIKNKTMWKCEPTLLNPLSRGRIELRSRDPKDPVKIIMNYYGEREDLEVMIKGIKEAIRISETQSFQRFGTKLIEFDLPGCDQAFGTDEYWECALRTATVSGNHACCTCPMGPNGVVDERLRVRGVRGLRVVDASVEPVIVRGHTNLPTYMTAEKASDMIKKDHARGSHPMHNKKPGGSGFFNPLKPK